MTNNHESYALSRNVWKLIIDLEMESSHFLKLGNRYRTRYRIIRYLLLLGILAEGAAVYFLAGQPPLLWSIAGTGAALIGSLTILDTYTNYAERRAALRAAAANRKLLLTETKVIQREIETGGISNAEAERRFERILNHRPQSTGRVTLETSI